MSPSEDAAPLLNIVVLLQGVEEALSLVREEEELQ
jgi:hypothetical protein